MTSVERVTRHFGGARDNGPPRPPDGSAEVPSTAGAPQPRRPLGTSFWRLWWASGISGSGDGLVAVALPLLTISLTRSPLVIAGVTAANRAGAAIAALPAGLLADRMDRHRMMVACNLVSGVALTGLVAAMTLGAADLVMVYLVAVVIAVCDVAYTLALQASVPDVVPEPDQLALGNGRLVAVEGAGEQLLARGGWPAVLVRPAAALRGRRRQLLCLCRPGTGQPEALRQPSPSCRRPSPRPGRRRRPPTGGPRPVFSRTPASSAACTGPAWGRTCARA